MNKVIIVFNVCYSPITFIRPLSYSFVTISVSYLSQLFITTSSYHICFSRPLFPPRRKHSVFTGNSDTSSPRLCGILSHWHSRLLFTLKPLTLRNTTKVQVRRKVEKGTSKSSLPVAFKSEPDTSEKPFEYDVQSFMDRIIVRKGLRSTNQPVYFYSISKSL